MEFKKQCPVKKSPDGRSLKGYYVDAVCIDGFTEGKKGKIVYRMPTFKLVDTSPETNQQAVKLDAELQQFLTDYFKRTRTEQVSNGKSPEPTEHAEPPVTPARVAVAAGADFVDDDIPF